MVLFCPRLCMIPYNEGLLVGHGNTVELYTSNGRLVSNVVVDPDNSAHVFGIKVLPSNDVLAYGERIVVFIPSSTLNGDGVPIQRILHFFDFVLEIQPLEDNKLAVLLSLNCIEVYKLAIADGVLKAEQEHSIQSSHTANLMKGVLSGDRWENMMSIVGTVFGEILVSKPSLGTAVLHKYTGHTGMIFGLLLHNYNVFSVSDDRSLRVWDYAQTNISRCLSDDLACQYGHSARPFAICRDDNEFVYTGGVDQKVCKWSWNATTRSLSVVDSVQLNIGGIRSLLWHEDKLWVGSENGGLVIVSFPCTKARSDVQLISSCEDLRGFNKCLGSMFTVNGRGQLFRDNVHQYAESVLRYIVTTPCHYSSRFVVAYGDNEVVFFNEDTSSLVKVDHVILSVVCTDTHAFAFTVRKEGLLFTKMGKLIARVSALEALSTINKTTSLVPSAMLIHTTDIGDILVVGSASGQLLYSKLPVGDASHTADEMIMLRTDSKVNRMFGSDHIMTLRSTSSDVICSYCKNGKWSAWTVENDVHIKLTLISSTSVSDAVVVDWPCDVHFHLGKEYISGFHSTDFLLIDCSTGLCVLRILCGGGNRPWQFFLDGGSEGTSTTGTLYFIRDKKLVKVKQHLRSFDVIHESLHRSQIVFVRSLLDNENGTIVCTAGNDNYLVFSAFQVETDEWIVLRRVFQPAGFICMTVLDPHSDVEEPSKENCRILVTGGGKGHISVWRVDIQALMSGKVDAVAELLTFDHQACTRVVDVAFIQGERDSCESSYRLATAYAEGTVETYSLTLLPFEKSLLPLSCLPPVDHSLTTKIMSYTSAGRHCIATVGTSGILAAQEYKDGNLQGVWKIQAAECGISSLSTAATDDGTLFALGVESGDSIVFLRNAKTLSNVATVSYHAATVTATHLFMQSSKLALLYSTALDCRLAVHSINLETSEVKLVRVIPLTVWDPTSFEVVGGHIVVAGSGLQTVEYDSRTKV